MHFQSLQYVVKTLDWCRPHNGQPPASPFSHREFLSACKTEIHEVFLNNRSRLSLIARQTAFFMCGDLSTSKGIVREG